MTFVLLPVRDLFCAVSGSLCLNSGLSYNCGVALRISGNCNFLSCNSVSECVNSLSFLVAIASNHCYAEQNGER